MQLGHCKTHLGTAVAAAICNGVMNKLEVV
jgi:hypothetical protein